MQTDETKRKNEEYFKRWDNKISLKEYKKYIINRIVLDAAILVFWISVFVIYDLYFK